MAKWEYNGNYDWVLRDKNNHYIEKYASIDQTIFGNKWVFIVERFGGRKRKILFEHSFDTKEEALKFAKSYIKKHRR